MFGVCPGAIRILPVAAALGALGFAALAPPLAAQEIPQPVACDERDSIVAMLEERYGEHHHASGLENDTRMIEIWVSQDNGTWTVLLTRPDGVSCIAAAGGSWFEVEAAQGVLH